MPPEMTLGTCKKALSEHCLMTFISDEDVDLFLLKQTYKSHGVLFLRLDIFCLAGSAQQAKQSTHLAEGLNPLYTLCHSCRSSDPGDIGLKGGLHSIIHAKGVYVHLRICRFPRLRDSRAELRHIL